MQSAGDAGKSWRDSSLQQWNTFLREREEQVFLVLTLQQMLSEAAQYSVDLRDVHGQ